MKTTRKPGAKKGGFGGGNLGTAEDDLIGQTQNDFVDAPTDDTEKPAVTEQTEGTTTDGAPVIAKPQVQLSLDDYMKQKAAADLLLLEKIGGPPPAIRKVEADTTGGITKDREDDRKDKKKRGQT